MDSLTFSENFGQEAIDVEEGKKENRSLATFNFKLKDFIRRYKNEDIYMVESLPVKMRGTYIIIMFLINQMAPKVTEFTMHKTRLHESYTFFMLGRFTDCAVNKRFPH